MDPFTIMAVGGLALNLFGSAKASSAASAYAQTQANVAGLESQVNDQRKAAMEVDARRRQLEIVRNNQRARSMAQTTATAQGAQFGSGLQGAYGGITGQSETNLLGVNQNLEIGRNIFGLDTKISEQRVAAAGFQGQQSTDQGIASMGSAMMGSAGTLGKIGQSAGNAGNFFGSLTHGMFGLNP